MSFLKRKKKEADPAPQEESVESILNEIKSIVSGEDDGDDALELTEMVDVAEDELSDAENGVEQIDEEKILSAPEPKESEVSDEDKFVDVLAEIDSSLSDGSVVEEVIQAVVTEVQEEQINQQPEEILSTPQSQIDEVLEEREVAVNLLEKEIGGEMSSETKEALISKEKAEKSTKAIKELMDNIPRPKVDSLSFHGGFTVEDLVTESLKPMLKNWLDKNLEVIVRDIVEREIRKILPREE